MNLIFYIKEEKGRFEIEHQNHSGNTSTSEYFYNKKK